MNLTLTYFWAFAMATGAIIIWLLLRAMMP